MDDVRMGGSVAREPTTATPRVDVDRLIYATITLMSVLIIYDGWQELEFLQIVGVIVGPVLAMFLAHVFSASLAFQVVHARAIRMRERLTIARKESIFLLLCVPPVLLTGILSLFGVSLDVAIRATLFMGTVSLGYWGGLAGRRAGLNGPRLALAVTGGLVIGLATLAVQILLQPGKPMF
jgi:hypothetical protein